MEKQPNSLEQSRFIPEPAESFEIDFINAKNVDINKAMAEIGGFVFRRSGSENEGRVYFDGERSDGTKIKITIEKGANYKSPDNIAKEQKLAMDLHGTQDSNR